VAAATPLWLAEDTAKPSTRKFRAFDPLAKRSGEHHISSMLESMESIALALALRCAVVASVTSIVTGYVLWRAPKGR
jgi:hypothetical protein